LNCIIKLLSNPELVLKMGSAGRKIAVEKFNYEKITEDWSKLINEIHFNSQIQILEIDQLKGTKLDYFRDYLRILKARYLIFKILIPSVYLIHTFESMRLHLEKLRG
jgi:hypothetical protein